MHATVKRLAEGFAYAGGLVLSVLILLTCLSILGRSINSILHSDILTTTLPGLSAALLATGVGPINGDFELVEAGMAFAIFAFLPLCQLSRGHASVDIFTARLSPGANRILQAVIDVTFAVVLIVIAWQLMGGMLSKRNSGTTTFLLEFPLWWAYVASLSGAAVAALTAVYLAAVRLWEAGTGRDILPNVAEAEL